MENKNDIELKKARWREASYNRKLKIEGKWKKDNKIVALGCPKCNTHKIDKHKYPVPIGDSTYDWACKLCGVCIYPIFVTVD